MIGPMPRVEQTRKGCPKCEGPLELHIETINTNPDGEQSRTARVARLLVCPSCGFSQEAEPVNPG